VRRIRRFFSSWNKEEISRIVGWSKKIEKKSLKPGLTRSKSYGLTLLCLPWKRETFVFASENKNIESPRGKIQGVLNPGEISSFSIYTYFCFAKYVYMFRHIIRHKLSLSHTKQELCTRFLSKYLKLIYSRAPVSTDSVYRGPKIGKLNKLNVHKSQNAPHASEDGP
jgi:hypothetical protein